jgi:hypothetical protein
VELGTDHGFLVSAPLWQKTVAANSHFGKQFYGGDLVGLAGLEPATVHQSRDGSD